MVLPGAGLILKVIFAQVIIALGASSVASG
jgi:hypothetical protein